MMHGYARDKRRKKTSDKIVKSKPSKESRRRNRRMRSVASNLVICDAGSLLLVVGGVDLEIGEQRSRLFLQNAKHRDRHPADFQLRTLAAAQLEHCAPCARV